MTLITKHDPSDMSQNGAKLAMAGEDHDIIKKLIALIK